MTGPDDTHVPQVGPDEELASALLDGEATDAEARRAAEPDVARAFTAYAEVAGLVGRPVEPVNAQARDAAIAAALTAFDRGETDEPDEPDITDELAARRSRTRVTGWLGAVAAALVVLAGLGLLASFVADDDESSSGETAASPTEETDAASAPTTFAATTAPGADAAEEAASAAGGVAAAAPYLGDYADLDGLFTAARADPDARQESATDASGLAVQVPPGSFTGLPCATEAEATNARLLGTATVDGAAATVLLETRADGTRSIVVLTDPDCDAVRASFGP
jgi:hypothetical protein